MDAAPAERADQLQAVGDCVVSGLREETAVAVCGAARHPRTPRRDGPGDGVHVEGVRGERLEVDLASQPKRLPGRDLAANAALDALRGRPLRLVPDGGRRVAVASLVDTL